VQRILCCCTLIATMTVYPAYCRCCAIVFYTVFNSLLNFRQASFAVDLSLFKMSVVAPAHDISAPSPNAIAQGFATNFLQKKTLSIQVRSRSNSPSQEDTETIPHVLPHTEIAKLSSEGAEAANRKRRRARA
jgi:hypothetical protein